MPGLPAAVTRRMSAALGSATSIIGAGTLGALMPIVRLHPGSHAIDGHRAPGIRRASSRWASVKRTALPSPNLRGDTTPR